MTKRHRILGGAALAAAAALVLTGCSAAGTAGGSKTITFWGWAPGYAAAVKAFNASHDDITVKYQAVQPGAKGGYQKMLNAVKANNAPCLAQVGYETLPSFAAQNALEDVTTEAASAKNKFQASSWKSVTIAGKTYGIPVDSGPMGLFYNKKLFDSLGLKAPTTWAEYATDAEKIHAADPSHYISSPYLNYDYAGLDWQTNASWFGTKGDKWKVTIDSAANKDVATYWQGLVGKNLISSAPMYDQAWYNGLGNGDIATVVGAVWQAGVIKSGAKDGSGDWAVAPMPQWKSGDTAVGNVGGAASAVLKGCTNDKGAVEFATWLATNRTEFSKLVDSAALYPAATALRNLPVLRKGDEYFGGQKIYEVFAKASTHVRNDWTWGPTMSTTSTALDDGLGSAWAGKSTISAALTATQKKTVAEMQSEGLSIAK